MKTIFSYNESEIKTDGSLEDLANGYNVWIDFADPDHEELLAVVYDDISQLIEFVESYEGTINSILELYVAKVSLQINDTMKVLTIFTVIMLPLTLIAGIYGMNGIDLNEIQVVPEGFIVVIITMICIGGGLLAFFIKKQWLLVRERDKQIGVHSEDNELHPKSNANAKRQVDYHIFKREKDG